MKYVVIISFMICNNNLSNEISYFSFVSSTIELYMYVYIYIHICTHELRNSDLKSCEIISFSITSILCVNNIQTGVT